jgi:hypothetical protein
MNRLVDPCAATRTRSPPGAAPKPPLKSFALVSYWFHDWVSHFNMLLRCDKQLLGKFLTIVRVNLVMISPNAIENSECNAESNSNFV